MVVKAGIILALLLVFVSNSMATENNTATLEKAGFLVADQEIYMSVICAEVSTPEPAWLLIHDSEDGELGEILGAIYIDEGVHKNVSMFMKVPEDGTLDELALVMHSDKGELGILDEHDVPMEDVDQKVIKLQDPLNVVRESEEDEDTLVNSEDEDSYPYSPMPTYYVRSDGRSFI